MTISPQKLSGRLGLKLVSGFPANNEHQRCSELILNDGCDHHWFENLYALVYVDDVTSRLMQLRFIKPESTFSHARLTVKAW